ncbi:hypothetical protein ACLOJK_041069 [Asimina triloba]
MIEDELKKQPSPPALLRPQSSEMESDDDLHFPAREQTPSPMHQTKLRRLKKASADMKTLDPGISTSQPEVYYESNDLESKASENSVVDLADVILPMSESDAFNDECEELGTGAGLEEEVGADDFGSASDGKGDGRSSEPDVVMDGFKLDESMKKRRSSRDVKEKDRKKKKSQFVNLRDEWKAPEGKPGRSKRKLEKEKAAYLELLHAESQRLLRDTRDASFKPVPLVQKPISSVLQKIRRRKLEVSKRSGISGSSDHLADTATSLRDVNEDLELRNVECDRRRDCNGTEKVQLREVTVFIQDEAADVVNPESYHPKTAEVSRISDSLQSHGVSTEEFQDQSQKPSDDPQSRNGGMIVGNLDDVTKELLLESQISYSEEKQTEDLAESTQEEDAFTPSVLVENLKLASACAGDESSDEEYNDKENIHPHPHKVADFECYPRGDPVKTFVDDEAEEEDDSDNDLMRFHDNEEDDDEEDNEELNDLIASGFREKPIDSEKRDELHQKWLEQQDAAATDNVLQRLKCGWKQKDLSLICEEEDEEELGEDSTDDSMDNMLPDNVTRKNSKKAKQMIAQMFDDGDEGFVSSDDEEIEQRLVRERLLEQNEEHSSFLSPAEDGNSREVFSLIKKLNIVPDSKKRAKTTSFFDELVTGGNSNSSSKSSFLGRFQSNSLLPSHKQGSCAVRSFIFGRDDSNSRSGLSASEHSSDRDQRKDRPAGSVSVKVSNSQSKSIGHNTKIEGNASSGTSLFEILQQSSMHSGHCIQSKKQSGGHEIRESQVVYQFSAFKSSKSATELVSIPVAAGAVRRSGRARAGPVGLDVNVDSSGVLRKLVRDRQLERMEGGSSSSSAQRRLDSLSRHLLYKIHHDDDDDHLLHHNHSSAMEQSRPVVIGGMVLDIQAKPFTEAKPGTTTPGKVRYIRGGVARNVAECMLRLGVKPFMISIVGLDMAGDLLLKHWKSSGLAVAGNFETGIRKCEGATTPIVSNIFDANGELAAGVASVEAVETFLTPEWIWQFKHHIHSAPVLMIDANMTQCSLEAACQGREEEVAAIILPLPVTF